MDHSLQQILVEKERLNQEELYVEARRQVLLVQQRILEAFVDNSMWKDAADSKCTNTELLNRKLVSFADESGPENTSNFMNLNSSCSKSGILIIVVFICNINVSVLLELFKVESKPLHPLTPQTAGLGFQQNKDHENSVQPEVIEIINEPLTSNLDTDSTYTGMGLKLSSVTMQEKAVLPAKSLNQHIPEFYANRYPRPVSTRGWLNTKVASSDRKTKIFQAQSKPSPASRMTLVLNQKLPSTSKSKGMHSLSSSSSSPWVLEVTKPVPGQIQKRLKQSTLLDMSRNFPSLTVGPPLANCSGEERKVISFVGDPTLKSVPSPGIIPNTTPVAPAQLKRKSLESTFGSEDDELFFNSPALMKNSRTSMGIQQNGNAVKNQLSQSLGKDDNFEWADDTLFGDLCSRSLNAGVKDNNPDVFPATPLVIKSISSAKPVKPQGILSLHNKRIKDKEFPSTMQLIQGFDKYVVFRY